MLIKEVKKTIEKYGMLTRGDRVLVAVSGGPDSVALLYLLYDLRSELELSLAVAHLDHGLRGEESRKEANFVRELAGKLDLPIEFSSIDLPALKRSWKLSVQEAARRARYQFFEESAKKWDAQRIAIGHNADDQAETILMRMLRGAGTRGLGGVPPVRGKYIRPLIEVPRERILGFLERKEIPFVTDSSNLKVKYLRNKIRLKLLPELEKEYSPGIRKNLLRAARLFREEEGILEAAANETWGLICKSQLEDQVTFDLPYFINQPLSLQFRLLRRAIEAVSGTLWKIDFDHIEALADLVRGKLPNKVVYLPRGIMAEKVYQELIIRKGTLPKKLSFQYPLEVPGITRLEEIGQVLQTRVLPDRNQVDFSSDEKRAYFDYHRLEPPLLVRNFREGDRFQPLGMEGMKKVKDYFIEKKLPRRMRDRIPLLVANDRIVWVIGFRIDHRVRIDEVTKSVLEVEISPKQ
ncbi:MAG: tRNA lysidine(34) synthetase TilS [Deltaproteobacteria bacterium]|nr:MAG: tRNA lysidine(34) synthetase TilS [Deltaproteobacteria bacterium]